jgi:6-phosphogluconolactonase
MNNQFSRWRVFPTVTELQEVAAEVILEAASSAIADHGRFDFVLAGGTTPRAVYELLRDAETDWQRWHVWFGDERCLPPEDSERNSLMASTALLEHVPIPPDQIHIIPAELGASAGAVAYCSALEGVGTFDLVLLGMGEDGHIASLFPGHPWEHHPPTAVIPVKQAPKPPPERVSMSASRLSNARQVVFLVTGESKRHAVQQWRGNATLPVKAIKPEAGVDIFIDAAASQ